MPDTDRQQVPAGLPAHLCSGREGFDALCSLLAITSTKRKQAISNAPFVKRFLKSNGPPIPRQTKTAERLRRKLILFYSDPECRRELWRSHIDSDFAAPDAEHSLIPSLEHAALSKYDPALLTCELDQEQLRACSDFYAPEMPPTDWQKPALAALPRLREEFSDWTSLDSTRKREVLTAGFAAATLLDDTRLLAWAADQANDIALEYDLVIAQVPAPDPRTDIDPSTPEIPDGNVLNALQDTAKALAAASNELAARPTAELFDTVANRAADILKLREEVLERAAAETVNNLLSDFAMRLHERAQDAPWLAAETDRILDAWRSTYESGMIRSDRLETDILRAADELETSLAKWLAADTQAAAAKAALDQHESEMAAKEAPSVRDVEMQTQRSSEVSSARQASFSAMRQLLDALAPSPSETHEVPDALKLDDAEDSANAPQSVSFTGEGIEPAQSVVANNQRQQLADADTTIGPSEDVPPVAQVKSPQLQRTAAPTEPTPSLDQTPDTGQPEREQGTGVHEVLSEGEAAVWEAVGNGRFGLAYQIARLLRMVEDRPTQPSPELLAALALGTAVRGPDDHLASEFGSRIGPLLANLDFGTVDQSIRDALHLLLFSASVRPALFASQQGGCIPLLRRVELSGDLTPIYRLANAVASHAESLQGVRLDVTTLSAVLDDGVWKDRVARHIEDVTTWRSSAGAATFLFAPASRVWKQWLTGSGILSELARLISTDEPAHAPRVNEIVNLLTNRKSVSDLVDNAYRKNLRRRGGSITGKALSQFEARLTTPIDLAQDWMRIIDAKPDAARFVQGKVERLSRDVNDLGSAARASIERVRGARPSPCLATALRCALSTIATLESILNRAEDQRVDIAIGPIQALSDDLLMVPGLRIDDQGNLDESIETGVAIALMTNAEAHSKTLSAAFDIRLDQGELHGADAICVRMAIENDPAEDECRERLEHALRSYRRKLQGRLSQLTEKLEQAFIIGEVSDDERADLSASITQVTRHLTDPDQTLAASKSAEAIERSVESRFVRGIEKVKSQLDPFLPLDNERERAFVQHALDVGDLTTLHEQLDCLKAGDPLLLDETGEHSHLRSFLEAADRIAEELNGHAGPSQDTLVRAVADRGKILGLDFSALSAAESRRSSEFLQHWFQMVRRRTVDAALISGFFRFLGFTVTEGGVSAKGESSAVVRTEALRSRELCPAHAFGSAANGRYDVLLNSNASAREPIIQAINANANRCAFVLHFGKLTTPDRQWLRQWSIRNATQFITIDETLVLYLSSIPSGTLRAMFDCTLPFSCTEPFFTAPGLVPPESFFGRESERRSIVDRFGSCFVYGGRQLGKTALLHAAQAAFHDPNARRLARCVDLKVHDIGIAFGADHIWQVLWNVCVELGIVAPDRSVPRGRDSLVEAIEEAITSWLAQDEDGQILLLLDEADAFLADDLKSDFRVSTRLKGLMDKTHRRFKVVLCGLHNVLRNTERANHPLAHFGEPICVGPLLGNGELQQARALISEPMAAVGYTFETENLLTQILVWTNYYPSLIQLYGEALIRHLRQAATRTVPYAVTSEDIQAVFTRDEFRDYIRERFSLTLQLDPRYELITYAMAFELVHGDSEDVSRSLNQTQIRKLATDAWSDGFNISEKEFSTLLLEMCGLGVLRRRRSNGGSSSYLFRNPNVLLLLGDSENMLEVLVKERDLPEAFEASAYHARYGQGNPQASRRGPLTYEQEALLKRGGRVAVLCGTDAANLSSLEKFLSDRMEQNRLRQLDLCIDEAGLRKQLTALRPGRGTYVYLVGGAPWTMRWLETAADALKRTRRGSAIRVAFQADPDQLWSLIEVLPEEYLDESNGLFDWIPAQPWNSAFLRRWCDDQNLHEANTKIDDLLDVSGGWPLLLERYAESDQKTWNAKIGELRDHIAANGGELLNALGLGTDAARLQLAALRDCDVLTPEDVEAHASRLSQDGNRIFEPGALRRRLCWALQLGLVHDKAGELSLNSLVSRILPHADL